MTALFSSGIGAKPMHRYKISEAAHRVSVTPDTLRYYERIGLLPAVARTRSGARLYTEADLGRLRFIRRAQRMRFTLAEIEMLMNLRDAPGSTRSAVRDLAARKLGEIEAQLHELSELRTELADLLARCASDEIVCPILEAMNDAVHGTRGETV